MFIIYNINTLTAKEWFLSTKYIKWLAIHENWRTKSKLQNMNELKYLP